MADDDRSLAELQDEAEARGLPKYGTKAELAERIDAYDNNDDDEGGEADAAADAPPPPADTDVDADDPEVGPSEGPGFGGLAEGESARAGGWVNRGDGKGWVLDDESGDKPRPPNDPRDEPVDPGAAGLPGHPVMGTAVGPVRTEGR